MQNTTAVELLWVMVGVFGAAFALANLTSSFVDQDVRERMQRELGELYVAGMTIAIDNILRESLVLTGLVACSVLGVLACLAPPRPVVNDVTSVQALIAGPVLIVIELCLFGLSLAAFFRRQRVNKQLAEERVNEAARVALRVVVETAAKGPGETA